MLGFSFFHQFSVDAVSAHQSKSKKCPLPKGNGQEHPQTAGRQQLSHVRFRQNIFTKLPMYLTYPLKGGITVTDSQGLSPYSMCRGKPAAIWYLIQL